jgi:hypothetical protein
MGTEGVQVSVTVPVHRHDLEALVETLAGAEFRSNPRLSKGASVIYLYENGSERIEPATMVKFPACVGRFNGLRRRLKEGHFTASQAIVTRTLTESHSAPPAELSVLAAAYRALARRLQAGPPRNSSLY